jgi:DNA-binding ferritin-like protein
MNEDNFSKEVENVLLKGTPTGTTVKMPSLKAVPEDPQRTTKQMLEQFDKIKQGLETELETAHKDLNRAHERVDDLLNAIHIMAVAIQMLGK